MSLDPPTYLSSLQNNIRARPIPWDGAVRAGTISEGQLSKIRAVDKVRKEQRKQTIEADLDAYRTLFVGGSNEKSVLESAAKRGDVVQYILVLLGDLIDGGYYYITNSHAILQPKRALLKLQIQAFQLYRKPYSNIQIPTNHCYLFSLNPPTLKIPFLSWRRLYWLV
jgi:hypothetical protein